MYDVFTEQIVKRKTDIGSIAKKFGIISAAIALSLGAYILGIFVETMMTVFPVIFAFSIYFGYIFLKHMSIEYEYSFTNGDLDIDKIAGRRKRSRVASIAIRHAALIAPLDERHMAEYRSQSVRKTIDASASPKDSGRWFIRYEDASGVNTILVFSPNDRVLDAIAKFAGTKMHRT